MIILGYFFLPLHKAYIVGTHWTEALLMSTRSILYFYGELEEIFQNYCQILLFKTSSDI